MIQGDYFICKTLIESNILVGFRIKASGKKITLTTKIMQGDHLYQLIQGMSTAEKRHFKVMWGAKNKQDEEPKYLQLYSLLNSMKNYDKDKLDARFPDNLAAFCKKLAENIFISLRQFHSGRYKSVQIKQLLVDIKYLYERGLHLICQNKLRRVKSMAEAIDDSAALIEINKFERLLYKIYRG